MESETLKQQTPVRTGVLTSCLYSVFHLQLISEQIQKGGPHPVQNFFLLLIKVKHGLKKTIADSGIVFDLTFIDSTTGYAVGENGIILKYLIETEDTYDSIITGFILYQNFPNPFNPVTKIKFTIPTSPLNPSPYKGERNRERLITLIVYDVLGKEIATLVNEEKPAGNYEVEFNGNGLTSGVYFYQLSADGFVQTKKMLMLK